MIPIWGFAFYFLIQFPNGLFFKIWGVFVTLRTSRHFFFFLKQSFPEKTGLHNFVPTVSTPWVWTATYRCRNCIRQKILCKLGFWMKWLTRILSFQNVSCGSTNKKKNPKKQKKSKTRKPPVLTTSLELDSVDEDDDKGPDEEFEECLLSVSEVLFLGFPSASFSSVRLLLHLSSCWLSTIKVTPLPIRNKREASPHVTC